MRRNALRPEFIRHAFVDEIVISIYVIQNDILPGKRIMLY